MRMRNLATKRLIMTIVCLAVAAAPAAAEIDVEVRLIPVESPGGSDVVPDVGSLPSNTLILNRSVTPEFFLEVWVSDVGSVNTGVISAYFDVTWDNGDLTDAIGNTCSDLFSVFCEGTIENGINQVTNFGGTDGSFQGQGVEPLFARVGLIQYSALADGEVTFDATVGLGEVGVFNRSVGEVGIIGANVIIVSCLTDDDCPDGEVCVDGVCVPDGCPEGDPCDDGNACTTNDTCSGGTCVGGLPPDCDDNNVCTDDSCDPDSGCVHSPNNDPCDDGDACTINDACSGGMCVGGPPPDCDDNNVCTDDSCDPASGCVHNPVPGPCDDGNACTDNDMCLDGECDGEPIECPDDGNPCTDTTCDPASGCGHVPNSDSCDDGDDCTDPDICSGGACIGGPPVDCDDGNACTEDSCDPASGCVHEPIPGSCDDDDACTEEDTCVDGECLGTTIPECVSTFLDIMPRTCPNSLRRQGGGNLNVALVGAGEFDPHDVDISSLLLARADGIGGEVTPRSHPAPSVRDRATPFLGELCDCHEDSGDGTDDLLVKFSKSEVVDVLDLDSLPSGAVLELVLTGTLLDGTSFSASDCILLAPPRGGGPSREESPAPVQQPVDAPDDPGADSRSATCGFGGLAALLLVTGLSLLRSQRKKWRRPRKP